MGPMKIYTRVGDGGYTYLFGGKKVRKDNDRVEAYGTVDELNSALGLAAALAKNADVQRRIGAIQRDLFVLGADLATPPKKGAPRVPRIGPAHVRRLEEEIDRMQKDLPPLRHFILPGGSPAGAALHLARAVCRRGERYCASLGRSFPSAIVYLNRLGDYLFVLARRASRREGKKETLWIPE